MGLDLTRYTTLTFDCYGTLIDWESGIWDALQPLIMMNGRDDINREAALSMFARCESRQQSETPGMLYPEILTHVHVQLARELKLETTASLNEDFGASVPHWPAFPDTADALRRLKKHFRLVILSNVNRAGFAASNRKLGVEFDAVYTAEDVGSYKPNPANFEYMLERLKTDHDIAPSDIIHTAQSLFHDHAPAEPYKLARAWIDRQNLAGSGKWGATARLEKRPSVDVIFPDMVSMADAAGL